MRTVLFFLSILWASPWSLVGILAGLLGLLTGGGARRVWDWLWSSTAEPSLGYLRRFPITDGDDIGPYNSRD